MWTMLGNCFKALPGTVAAKTLVSSQAAHRRAGVSHTFTGSHRASRTCDYLHLTDEEAGAETGQHQGTLQCSEDQGVSSMGFLPSLPQLDR